ncbi:MAG TPA: IopA [Pseudonocardiaceae bacterium]|jgi:hypothetical protein|nr:IopA [Pseudonocardiaceae bacterium]
MQPYDKLVPQLAQYEAFITRGLYWLPYVMYFNTPNHRSTVVNTDSGGFRISHGGANTYSVRDQLPHGPVSILMGGSSAFGLGATCDEKTLPSLLSRNTSDTPWLNLTAPAFNSTQEVIIFLLHRHQLPEIRDIVIFSGLNNLVLAGLPGATEKYGQFFFSGEFYEKLCGSDVDRSGISHTGGRNSSARKMLSRAARLLHLQGGEPADGPTGPSPEARVEIATSILANDLDRLLELAAPTGARIHFVLQPAISWTGKKRSPEEVVLLDDRTAVWSKMWDSFRPVFEAEVYQAHAPRVEQICKSRGISFIDMNDSLLMSPDSDRWLFVDAVHLNDDGNEVVSEILTRDLDLK